MAYIALYRKWRPTSFDEVRGQDAVVTTLKNQIIHDRVGHAYLFCGSRGTGKTTVAKIFAKAVNCLSPVNGCACGSCAMCRAVENGSSVNVIEIDAASNNGVDNIREIREEVQYRPAEGNYRIYIIDEVHMLSIGAFNALLKTLEEPPAYVIFILATTEPHKVPMTILSRCQRYDFHRIGLGDIVGRLKELAEWEHVTAEDAALRYIARKADGALRDAISLFDQSITACEGDRLSYEDVLRALGTVDSDVLSRLLRALLAADPTAALTVVEEVRLAGRELSQFVQDFIWYLRNLLLLMTAEADGELLEMSREDWLRLQEEAAQTEPAVLMRYIRLFSALFNEMRTAVDKRVLLEVAVIKATRPAMERDLESLTERVLTLERKLREGLAAAAPQPAPEPVKLREPEAEAPVLTLEPARFEELQALRESWPALLKSLEHQLAIPLKNVWLEPKDGGVMDVVFREPFDFNMVSCFHVMEALSEKVREKLKKEVRFDCRLAKAREQAPRFISDEELTAIHMDIETEEN